jgi:hypothetical protein
MTLTIELIPCNHGPVSPDLLYVGLTDVRDLIKYFDEVWQVTGLSKWFRCRWRIEINHKDTSQPGMLDYSELYPKKLGGNSSQAAALVAMLAASGDPYGFEKITSINDFPSPEKIALDVAISAAVNCASDKPVKELSLSEVGSIPKKLYLTRNLLDYLVLFEDEKDDNEQQLADLRKKRQEHDQEQDSSKREKVPPVGIEYASTVEHALNLLLESNQYQTAYRTEINSAWLKQWEAPTGRFPGAPPAKPGDPDFENQPEDDEVDEEEASAASGRTEE